MPICNGVESTILINNFIKEKQIHHIPIIACSAFNGKEEKNKLFEVGIQEFLNKPL